jgi:hypothetical protein
MFVIAQGGPFSNMRLYFHLRSDEHTLPDLEGIEVVDMAQARRLALEIMEKVKQEDPSRAQDWSGWTLIAVDAAGGVVFSFDLDSSVG